MIHVLISQFELSEYLFKDISGIDTIFVPVLKHNPLKHRIIKAAYYHVYEGLYSYYYPKSIIDRLRKIPSEDCLIVISEDTYSFWVLFHLCKHIKNKIAYFWNPCSSIINQKVTYKIRKKKDRAESIVEYIRSLGFKMATFDKNDSELYHMSYFPQFYRRPKSNVNQGNTIDFFFCGRDKGRKLILEQLKQKLDTIGKTLFLIQTYHSDDILKYPVYIEKLKSSNVICEVVQPGQTGLTIRAMEALFYKKKLLTNNLNVKKYNFYNKNNILIFDDNTSVNQLKAFLKYKYSNIEENILDMYEVSNFCNSLSKL